MRYTAHLITIISPLFFINAWCQETNHSFYYLTTANGLSSNQAAAVIQDKEGFYWIATTDGLNRFDGSSCLIYRNNKTDTHTISHNNCIFLLSDDQDDIWIGTQVGVNRFNKRKKLFDRFYLHHPLVSTEKINWIRGLIKDDKGNIFIASEGLWQYNIFTGQWNIFLHDPQNPASPPAGILSSLQYDPLRQGLWMSADNGYVFFDIASKKFYHKNNNPGQIALCNEPGNGEAIVLDRDRSIWFRQSGSLLLSKYNIDENRISNTGCKLDHGFFKLSVDDQRRIWIHNWGARTLLFDPLSGKLVTDFLESRHPRSALDSIARDLYIDKEKKLLDSHAAWRQYL